MKEPRENLVRITAADYNGRSFDGSPFDHIPIWLTALLGRGILKINNAESRLVDYAVWTLLGHDIALRPGDEIEKTEDGIVVHYTS